ncbi:hypothetical protein [Bacillus phage vB_BanS-Thrax2]|nr:hypothetical protein [Bacillus phage vB_BanS-Thrax2]
MFKSLIGKTVLVLHETNDDSWVDSIVTVKEVKFVGRREFFGKMIDIHRPVVEHANGHKVLLNSFREIFEVEDLQEDLLVRDDEKFKFIGFEKVKCNNTYEFLYVIQNVDTHEIIKLQTEYAMYSICPTFKSFFKIK